LVNQDHIMGITQTSSVANAVGKKIRVLAPIQQDANGYFIKPYLYSNLTPDAGTSTTLLSYPSNYVQMLDMVRLTN
nr:hypothetical protein [Spirochaetota bacterium]